MKKYMAIILSGIIAAGCVAGIPMTERYTATIDVQDPSLSYSAAIDCASRVVRPPAKGQFFTYQSDKLNKFILTFGMEPITSIAGVTDTVDAVMRYSTSNDNKQATLEISDFQICNVQYGVCSNKMTEGAVKSYYDAAKSLLSSMEQCIKDSQ